MSYSQATTPAVTFKGVFFKTFFCIGLLSASTYIVHFFKGSSETQLVASDLKTSRTYSSEFPHVNVGSPPPQFNFKPHDAVSAAVATAAVEPAKEGAEATANSEAAPSPAPEEEVGATEQLVPNPELAPFYTSYSGGGLTVDNVNSVHSDSHANSAEQAALDQPLGAGVFMPAAAAATYTSGGYSNSQSNGTQTTLSAQDIAILTSHPLSTAFDNIQLKNLNGQRCPQGANCAPYNDLQIWQTRWDRQHGINPVGTALSLQNVAASIPVQFNFQFKIQDASLTNDTLINLQMVPTSVSVSYETVGTKNYNVYQFILPNANAMGNTLSQMSLTLIYQITQAANGTKTGTFVASTNQSASELRFSRTSFSTLETKWEPGQYQFPPTVSYNELIVNRADYSLHIQ